jgi:hypothetical protein
MSTTTDTVFPVTYDLNIRIINIINNIINKQTPELIKTLSIKENLSEDSLKKCVERFNKDYDPNMYED